MNDPKRPIRMRKLLKAVLGVSTVSFTFAAGCLGNLMIPPDAGEPEVIVDAGETAGTGVDAGGADASVSDAGETDAGSDGGS
jgi:hypothetical protein